jgi:SagB-type dehydrogenase family enzyme
MSLEEALARRRSVRDYAAGSLTLEQVAQLLWAAQGVSDPVGGRRTAPSAGALYPLQIYAVAARVAALPAGVYRYVPGSHSLERVRAGPAAASLAKAALLQIAVAEAPLTLAVTADFSRTTGKYGERGRRYAVLEAGHAAQNVCLQAVALGLGAVPIGAFSDGSAARILGLPPAQTLLYLLPVGEPAQR